MKLRKWVSWNAKLLHFHYYILWNANLMHFQIQTTMTHLSRNTDGAPNLNELNRNSPKPIELFRRTHHHRKDNTCVDRRSEHVNENLTHTWEEPTEAIFAISYSTKSV